RVRDRVEERRAACFGGEADRGGAAEHLRPRGEVEGYVVAVDVDVRLALLGFNAGEVVSGHGGFSCESVVAALVARGSAFQPNRRGRGRWLRVAAALCKVARVFSRCAGEI